MYAHEVYQKGSAIQEFGKPCVLEGLQRASGRPLSMEWSERTGIPVAGSKAKSRRYG